MSPYFNDKLSLFLTEVSFETSEENQLSYFQNGYFFKILWWSHQPHNKGICRWKNKIISECFTINNHGFSFVSFSTDQTLLAFQMVWKILLSKSNCLIFISSKKMGFTVPKWVLIVWPKIPQMPKNLSAQFACPDPKVLDAKILGI